MYSVFTKEMKKDYTILAPDIFPIHMELVKEIFRMYGYHLDILHYTGKKVVDTGLEHLHNDLCYPAICMLGQQLYGLTCGDYDPHKTALIQFQTGGGCRASNYIWLLRKALYNMGMSDVPVISLSFNKIEECPGFKVTPPFLAKGLMAILYGDMLMLLRNQVRPYEQQSGQTLATVGKWNRELSAQFRRNEGLLPAQIRQNLQKIAADFAAIPVCRTEKVKVGIVGEIYVKYSPFGNNNLEEFLFSEGCEYMVPGVLSFLRFLFYNKETDYLYYGGSQAKKNFSVVAGGVIRKLEKIILEVLRDYPQFTPPATFSELCDISTHILDRGVKMGEGWLLPAEMGELIEKGYHNIVCAQPFGCLPNHIVGKGIIRKVKEYYPQANVCPIDFDAGASPVNQENRIRLMLALAREGGNANETDRS